MVGMMEEQVFCEIVLRKLPSSYNSLRTTLDKIGGAELSWEKIKGLILTVADRGAIAEGVSDNVLTASRFIHQSRKFKRPQTSETWRCFNCNKPGHLSKDCWSKPQNQRERGTNKGHNGQRRMSDNTHTLMLSGSALSAEANNQDTWIIDSGATQHMSSNSTDIVDYKEFQSEEKVYLANNKEFDVNGCGHILMKCKLPNNKHEKIKLGKVLHVPELKGNLISVPAITKNGGTTLKMISIALRQMSSNLQVNNP
eukprot:gene2021-2298_t